MAKTFIYSITAFLLLNFIIKTALYCYYEKTTGTVTDLYESDVINHGARKTYREITVVPTVEYPIDGKKYTITRPEWGFPGGFSKGQKVQLMYSTDKELPELNSFFQYWLTLKHLAVIFGLSVLLTAIIESVREIKNPEA
jgi:hypothetical protein